MFTFFCITCEAKLIVKEEKLIGKIVPCPKCGSMVLVSPPDEAPTPLYYDATPKPGNHKRFPDVLTNETASGVIGHTSKVNLRAEEFLEVVPQESDISETEVKTRKILVKLLVGLMIFLLVAVGFLIAFRRPDRPQQQELPLPQQPAQNVQVPIQQPEPQKIDHTLIEEVVDVVPPSEKIIELVPPPGEHILSGNDTLSIIEERMSEFAENAVPNIDIDAKLALPILELNLEQHNLIEFVRTMSRLTNIPMTLDIDEMRPLSLVAKTPVSGQFRETTAGEILTETLATLGLQWIITDRQILILPKKTTNKTDLTFDVSDFVDQTDDLTPQVLAEMVQRLVVPDGTVAILPDSRLSVEPSENNRKSSMRLRDDILRFLEQFRAVRQLPQKTEWTAETLAPEAFGWDQVMEPMTLNHYRAIPFSLLITQLEAMTDLTIIVDHQSLHQVFCPFAEVPATVQCDSGTINDVLELSLDSVDLAALTYRIVDYHTLEITTLESAKQPDKMVMEVHRYELFADETPEDIVRALRSMIVPDSWVVPEFLDTQFGSDVVIDRVSGCLFVRQSQPAQRQIRLFLSALEPVEPEGLMEP